MKSSKKICSILLFGIFLAIIIGLTWFFFPYIRRLSDPSTQIAFENWVTSLGVAGPLVMFSIQVLQIIIAFIPGGPVEIISGVLYGTLGGTAICIGGCVLASIFTFSLSRKFGKKLLYVFVKPEKIDSWHWLQNSQKIETITFVLFFIPGTPKDLLTYIVGITDMSMVKFLVISSFARLPSIFSSAMMGATMRQGEWKLSLIVFLITGVVGILGITYKDKVLDFCHRLAKKK